MAENPFQPHISGSVSREAPPSPGGEVVSLGSLTSELNQEGGHEEEQRFVGYLKTMLTEEAMETAAKPITRVEAEQQVNNTPYPILGLLDKLNLMTEQRYTARAENPDPQVRERLEREVDEGITPLRRRLAQKVQERAISQKSLLPGWSGLPADQEVVRIPIERRDRETDKATYATAEANIPSTQHPDHTEDRTFADSQKKFFGDIDGMGGHVGGEQAAMITRHHLSTALASLPEHPTVTQTEQAFRNGFIQAHLAMNQAIEEQKNHYETLGQAIPEKENLKGMGAVVIAAQIVEEGGKRIAVIAQAGDARLLIVKRDGSIGWRTQDEGLAAKRPDIAHKLDTAETPEDVAELRRESNLRGNYWDTRNIVTHSLKADSKEPPTPSFSTQELADDDALLLFESDGIHDNLTAGEIQTTIQEFLVSGKPLQELPQTLTQKAKARSGLQHVRHKPDDMSVLAVDIAQPPPPSSSKR